jgi:hypothetical protein
MTEKDEAARRLAELHYRVEEGMRNIFRLRASPDAEVQPDEPIKLLEINEDTVAAGIMPLHFGAVPDRGIPFPCVIVEITPEEYQQLQLHELRLPGGWTVGEQLPKPADVEGPGA